MVELVFKSGKFFYIRNDLDGCNQLGLPHDQVEHVWGMCQKGQAEL